MFGFTGHHSLDSDVEIAVECEIQISEEEPAPLAVVHNDSIDDESTQREFDDGESLALYFAYASICVN